MKYRELKKVFEENKSNLPATLSGGHIVFNNLKENIKEDFKLIDNCIEKHGNKGAARNAGATAAKARLTAVFLLLKEKEYLK